MFHFTIGVAGKIIGIESVYKRLWARSQDYLVDEVPDFTVCSSQKEIDQTRKYVEMYTGESEPLDRDVELSVLLKKIADKMLDFNTLLMHGTVVAVDNRAFLFTAPSGTGKSTHVKKWLFELDNAYIVNGDKPFIIIDERPMVCGTPWAGKERWQTNTKVPLEAIIWMERNDNNEIRKITFSEAFPKLLSQTYQPKESEKLILTLKLLKLLDHRIRFYHFKFNNLKEDAFQVAYNELVGN